MGAFSLNHYNNLVDPITLCLLSKHAEKTLWRFPIFIFNILHPTDSLTPQNWNAVKKETLMLVLFSVAFYLEELGFYISNQGDMKKGFSVLAFIQKGETEKERH